jgi:hypothetical protein
MATSLAQLLAAATAPQDASGGPPSGIAPPLIPPVGPPDLRARARLPSSLVPGTYEGTTLSPATEAGDYVPLIDPARSRFPPGLLDALGLGVNRNNR